MIRRATNVIVVHCAATKPSQNVGVEEIRKWHTSPPRNWADIGYHYVIRRDGSVERGRFIEDVGAHVEGHNLDTVGVCLVGGVDEQGHPANNFTQVQMDSLFGLLVSLRHRYPQADICGHRDFPNVQKACPSFDVRSWVAARPELAPRTAA